MLQPSLKIARLAVVAFAGAAVVWALIVIPKLRRESVVVQVASRIFAGEVYKTDFLNALDTAFLEGESAKFRPSVLSKVAIIKLQRAEDAIAAGSKPLIDARLEQLSRAIDNTMENSPAEPFLWLVRFQVANTPNGYDPNHLSDFRMSYILGPHEGWIAAKRNRIAMEIYQALPNDLALTAIAEFGKLVRSHFYSEAIDILAGPGRRVHEKLLAQLSEFSEPERRAFAKALYDKNLDDMVVPGVQVPPPRPWR